MDEGKITDLLISLASQMSGMRSDIQALKEDVSQNTKSNEEKDKLMKEFIEERTKYAAQRQDAIKAELLGKITLVSSDTDKNSVEISILKKQIDEIKTKDDKRVLTRWEQIKDYVFKAVMVFTGSALAFYIMHIIQK